MAAGSQDSGVPLPLERGRTRPGEESTSTKSKDRFLAMMTLNA